MDLEWTSEASVVAAAVRDTYCIMLAICLCGWSRAEAFLGSNRSHKQGQAEKQGSCQENSGWGGLSAWAGSLQQGGTLHNRDPPLVQLLGRRKETSIFPLPLCA